MSERAYVQRKRAESRERTRDRIVEALIALHQEVGAAGTTVSDVARRAGVQRLTVYRHFPDEGAMLEACTSRWFARNPPPGEEAWAGVEDPRERVRRALAAFYAYYRGTADMMRSSYRDRDQVPALALRMEGFEAALDALAESLVQPLGLRGRARRETRATLRHGLEFGTWSSLDAAGIADGAAARLVGRWVEGAGAKSGRGGRKGP